MHLVIPLLIELFSIIAGHPFLIAGDYVMAIVIGCTCSLLSFVIHQENKNDTA